jgi:hypothetical protein
MKRAIVTVFATAALLVAGIGTAFASTSQCSAGNVCIWDDSNFNVFLGQKQQGPGTCWTLPASMNDKANGFYNHLLSGRHVQMYKDPGCTGPLLRDWDGFHGPFPDGEVSLFYHSLTANDQDRLSSIFFNTG